MAEIPELEKQNAKFGYKAPESVYHKHDPKSTLVGSGKFYENQDSGMYFRNVTFKCNLIPRYH
jgi:hypothetical protein